MLPLFAFTVDSTLFFFIIVLVFFCVHLNKKNLPFKVRNTEDGAVFAPRSCEGLTTMLIGSQIPLLSSAIP